MGIDERNHMMCAHGCDRRGYSCSVMKASDKVAYLTSRLHVAQDSIAQHKIVNLLKT